MTATFQYGQILQGQERFDEAIAAWKGYLANFPNGPQAPMPSAILDTQLLIAADHSAASGTPRPERPGANSSPRTLSIPRAPSPVPDRREFRHREEVRPGDRRVGSAAPASFPSSEPAAHAQFQIASIFETEKGDPAAAIERFKKIAVEPWRSQAQQRIAVMESRRLTVLTPAPSEPAKRPASRS